MVVIALGANLPSKAGAPETTLKAALSVLKDCGAVPVAVSRFYRTAAWPDAADPAFVNAAARLKTRLPPSDLLNLLHAVETSFGRDREAAKNAPRTLDLDLIDYDGRVESGPPELPHPRVATRVFVLVPLKDIAPDWRHPATGKSVDELIAALGEEVSAVKLLA